MDKIKDTQELDEIIHALKSRLMTAKLTIRLAYNLLSLAEMQDDLRPAVRSTIDVLRKSLKKSNERI